MIKSALVSVNVTNFLLTVKLLDGSHSIITICTCRHALPVLFIDGSAGLIQIILHLVEVTVPGAVVLFLVLDVGVCADVLVDSLKDAVA